MIRLCTPDEWDNANIHAINIWLTETFQSGWRWSGVEYPEPYVALFIENEADAMMVKLKFGFV